MKSFTVDFWTSKNGFAAGKAFITPSAKTSSPLCAEVPHHEGFHPSSEAFIGESSHWINQLDEK
jgi:hypothetical protein